MNILGINARVGDGHLSWSDINARVMFNGKNVQWINFKRDVAIKCGLKVTPIKPSYSGYKDDWSLVQFQTMVSPTITEVGKLSRLEIIKILRKIDLILWYIDDGSWHKHRKSMHLYCNDLNTDELEILLSRFEKLYGTKPTIYQDRKKDGRSYPYLYLPKKLSVKFRRDVRRFLKWNGLDTLYYKVGETSETIHME